MEIEKVRPSISEQEKEMDELANQINNNMAIVFTEEELSEARAEFNKTLVVKLAGGRGFNRAAFKGVLRNIWNPQHGLNFTEVENNVLLAKFNSESDMERVLKEGPWRYMGWAVQVEKWQPGKSLAELFTGKMQLWVQIHNLPVEYRKESLAAKFAEKAGKIVSYGKNNKGTEGERDERRIFVRFKVEIDLNKPVVPGWELARGKDAPLWINFKYEKLPNICFSCGSFQHETANCLERSLPANNAKFGPHLRANHVALDRLNTSYTSRAGKTSSNEEADESSDSIQIGDCVDRRDGSSEVQWSSEKELKGRTKSLVEINNVGNVESQPKAVTSPKINFTEGSIVEVGGKRKDKSKMVVVPQNEDYNDMGLDLGLGLVLGKKGRACKRGDGVKAQEKGTTVSTNTKGSKRRRTEPGDVDREGALWKGTNFQLFYSSFGEKGDGVEQTFLDEEAEVGGRPRLEQ